MSNMENRFIGNHNDLVSKAVFEQYKGNVQNDIEEIHAGLDEQYLVGGEFEDGIDDTVFNAGTFTNSTGRIKIKTGTKEQLGPTTLSVGELGVVDGTDLVVGTNGGYKYIGGSSIICFENIKSMMESKSLKFGDICETSGYYSINDGGSCRYIVSATKLENISLDIILDNEILYCNPIPTNDTINVKQFGAVGDGVTDDTINIQKSIDFCEIFNLSKVIIPDGVYMLTCDKDNYIGTYLVGYGGINLPSNIILELSPGTVLKCIPNSSRQYNIIYIADRQNVKIVGNGARIIGDRNNHSGSSGEWGYGISVLGSNNVCVDNLTCCDCWGDGINIQISPTSSKSCIDINITNTICDNNRRQGMSIEGVTDMYISNSKFLNTNGTAPGCGVDIEPWSNTGICNNIHFNDCFFGNNAAGGLLLMTQFVSNVFINNCTFDSNKSPEGNILLAFGPSNVNIINCKVIGGFGKFSSVRDISVNNCISNSGVLLDDCDNIFFTGNIIRAINRYWEHFAVRSNCGYVCFKNNEIIGPAITDMSEYLINFDCDTLILEGNILGFAKRSHIKANNLTMINNKIESMKIVVGVTTRKTGVIKSNYFRNVGGGTSVIFSTELKNCIMSDNTVSKYVTTQELDVGFINRDNLGSFILLSGNESDFENISLIGNSSDYDMVQFSASSNIKDKVLICTSLDTLKGLSSVNLQSVVGSYSDISKNIQCLTNYSISNSSVVRTINLGKITGGYRYLINITLSPGWATYDRTGVIELCIDISQSGILGIKSNTNSSKSQSAFRLSKPYVTNGETCLSITTPSELEIQNQNMIVEIKDLGKNFSQKTDIRIDTSVPQSEFTQPLYYVVPNVGGLYDTIPTESTHMIPVGCIIIHNTSKKLLYYLNRKWYDSMGNETIDV